MERKIRLSAEKRILFLPHAIKQMSRADRMISVEEISMAVFNGEVIEEYPNDERGESCLVFHLSKNRAIHVVCAPRTEYLAIITAYVPSPDQWSRDYKERR